MPADIHGILLLDKPIGLSSAGAVARVKRLFNARKAGHTGSLDPLASGLLPICFGEATKFGAQLLEADKTYRVTVRLGERTPSADRESEVIERRELQPYSAQRVEEALVGFPREYAQVPPMHSALKQDGKPLYEYARAGITRARSPRAIIIHEMRLLGWQPPDLSFDVRCSKGAYIRVLAEDLAARLGTIGHLAAAPQTRCCAVWRRNSMVLRGTGIVESGGTAGSTPARRCRPQSVPTAGFVCGRSECVSSGPDGVDSRRRTRKLAGYRAYLCGGPRISGFGADRAHRPAGAIAADCQLRLIPSLRGSAATRTMRAFLKGLSY